jgi:hypothetical protein
MGCLVTVRLMREKSVLGFCERCWAEILELAAGHGWEGGQADAPDVADLMGGGVEPGSEAVATSTVGDRYEARRVSEADAVRLGSAILAAFQALPRANLFDPAVSRLSNHLKTPAPG